MKLELEMFPFDVKEDTMRFEQCVIEGENGYYDNVARKFVSQTVLDMLMAHLMPEKDYLITPDSFEVEQAENRMRRNLSVYQRNPTDSYAQNFLKYVSNRFLSSKTEMSIDAAILYVDIVGSTNLASKLPPEELSSLIRVFSQEMSIIISKHAGFVLKYAGDAVIAYFPHFEMLGNMVENAVRCGRSMNIIISRALNKVLDHSTIPPIQIRVSIDSGSNKIVFLGSEPDLIGHTITIASKMVPFAKPGELAIGDNAFKQLSDMFANEFENHDHSYRGWNHTDPSSGEIYPIHFSKKGCS